jgi:hypothetical protein
LDLIADRYERQGHERRPQTSQQRVEPRRVCNWNQENRDDERDEGREGQQPSRHRARADSRSVTVQRRHQEAESRQHQIGAHLVDQDAQAQSLWAVIRFDHREPDERGVR